MFLTCYRDLFYRRITICHYLDNEARVKILGGGCAKCNQLEAATVEALTELGMDTTIDHVKDYEKIANKTKGKYR